MAPLPEVEQVRDIELNKDPELEAWLFHFLVENNIEYLLNPFIVASPEQLRFMVALRPEQMYAPASDEIFLRIYRKKSSKTLDAEYLDCWRFLVKFVRTYKMNPQETRRILSLCRYRFRMYFADKTLLPSRMLKRLLSLVLTQWGESEPYRTRKRLANAHAVEALASEAFQTFFDSCPAEARACEGVRTLRQILENTELSRLMVLSTFRPVWEGNFSARVIEDAFASVPDDAFAVLDEAFGKEEGESKNILFLPDVAGGCMLDIEILRTLLRQGHRVVLALKDAFYFDSLSLADVEEEGPLKRALASAYVLQNDQVTKNELLALLREHRFVVISDGTSEQLNLYRAGVTFARAWKECDLIIAKGRRNREILLGTSHEFTRDILCFWRETDGGFHSGFKPKASWVRRFSEKDIRRMADNIIASMRAAKAEGRSVMFYSAIIGSIPGQTKVAVSVVNTFVAHLRNRMEHTFIINPAEYFEEGMDGDDLMYMWERVQRSGLLDVWRFQTVEDIETSFSLKGKKVPSLWSGKDSTFSTGCTKEMRIAMDEQQRHPELQIIGPAAERFFRRRDYGIGKYFDASLRG